MKKRLIVSAVLLFMFPLLVYGRFYKGFDPLKSATVFNPVTGERKVVTIGDPDAFKGGFVLEVKFGAVVPNVVAGFQTSLAQKLTTSEVSSMTLVSGTTDDGTTLNGTYGFTLDEGTSNKEYIVATCVNTACANLIRGISSVTGSTSVSSLIKEHRRGASVKITDHPLLSILSNLLNGRDTIPSKLKYDPGVAISGTDSTSTVANIDYVNNVATSGAADMSETVKGLPEGATRGEMAAGTATGGTGALLVLQSKYATSTSQVATTSIVVTKTDGKIDPSFLTGTNYTFSGSTTLASSSFSSLPTGPNSYPVSSTTIANKGYVDLTSAAYSSGSWSSSTPAIGTINIAHGLGYTPRMVKITAYHTSGPGTGFSPSSCYSVYSGGSWSGAYVYANGSGNYTASNFSTPIYLKTGTDEVITSGSLTSTNITIQFTTFSGSRGVILVWEAYK